MALLQLIAEAAIWTDIARGFAEASPARRSVLVLEWVGSGLLVVYLFGEWSPEAGLAAAAVVVALDMLIAKFLLGRKGTDEEEDQPRPSPDEIRVRAARERAERDLAARGSHHLATQGPGVARNSLLLTPVGLPRTGASDEKR